MAEWVKISAKKLRTMPIGTVVRVNSYDKYGYPGYMDCVLIPWGKGKKLRYSDHYGPVLYNITTETERRYYTVQEAT